MLGSTSISDAHTLFTWPRQADGTGVLFGAGQAAGAASVDAVPAASGATEAGDAEFNPPTDHEGFVSMEKSREGSMFVFNQDLTAAAAGAALPRKVFGD